MSCCIFLTCYVLTSIHISLGAFAIDFKTGEINAIGLLDRETKSNYTLDVAATDMDPVHPRRNTTVVYVEVLDTNDNSPVFDKESYVTNMVEHSAKGKTVIQVLSGHWNNYK